MKLGDAPFQEARKRVEEGCAAETSPGLAAIPLLNADVDVVSVNFLDAAKRVSLV